MGKGNKLLKLWRRAQATRECEADGGAHSGYDENIIWHRPLAPPAGWVIDQSHVLWGVEYVDARVQASQVALACVQVCSVCPDLMWFDMGVLQVACFDAFVHAPHRLRIYASQCYTGGR